MHKYAHSNKRSVSDEISIVTTWNVVNIRVICFLERRFVYFGMHFFAWLAFFVFGYRFLIYLDRRSATNCKCIRKQHHHLILPNIYKTGYCIDAHLQRFVRTKSHTQRLALDSAQCVVSCLYIHLYLIWVFAFLLWFISDEVDHRAYTTFGSRWNALSFGKRKPVNGYSTRALMLPTGYAQEGATVRGIFAVCSGLCAPKMWWCALLVYGCVHDAPSSAKDANDWNWDQTCIRSETHIARVRISKIKRKF